MNAISEDSAPFLALAETSGLSGADPAWLKTIRADGADRYAAQGLPHIKLEEWKYTNLLPLADIAFRGVTADDGVAVINAIPGFGDAAKPCARLVMVNGSYRADLSDLSSLPEGVRLESLSETAQAAPEWLEQNLGRLADGSSRGLVSLNDAALNTGFVLHVAKGVTLGQPVEIVSVGGYVDDAIASFPRNLIVLEEGAEARVILSHAGSAVGEYLSNSVTEITVAENAKLRTISLQEDSLEAAHLSTVFASVAGSGVFDSFTLTMGGRMTRNDVHITLDGEGAECRLDGAYLMRGRQHCDNTTRVEHRVPNTSSDEMFKGVLDDEARAVFQGKIVVERDAQKTDGQMLNKTMLLSDEAEIDTKPELEIYADDVKCSHGAASGQVDEAALFYLRSRGIPEAQARNLLIQSFMGQVVERIHDDGLRDLIIDKIVHWLPAACYRQEEWRS